MTHRSYLDKLANDYLSLKVIDLVSWCKSVKDRKRADVLALFVLCLINGTICFVHLKENKYWTSLKETPTAHLEFIQRCNVHLSYLERGIFVEHVLRMTKVSYRFFGVDQPIEMEET